MPSDSPWVLVLKWRLLQRLLAKQESRISVIVSAQHTPSSHDPRLTPIGLQESFYAASDPRVASAVKESNVSRVAARLRTVRERAGLRGCPGRRGTSVTTVLV